ncbi:hypothetical protein, partial [Klebsiella pneumoniae]|uniref:hypothetical protein n=1 Tax=Klebsiella pneumoniae TaxID=573 RepID=UPI002717FC48
KSAQIREILISESAWEEMTCLFAPSLGASGIALAGWFFFFSVNEYKFLWGLLSVVGFLVGYLIYRFAYAYIYDEWNYYH